MAKQLDFSQENDDDDRAHTGPRAEVLKNGLTFDEARYEFKEDWVPADLHNPLEIHSTHELIEGLKRNPKWAVDARVLGMDGHGATLKRISRNQLIESSKARDSKKLRESASNMRESFDNWEGGGAYGYDQVGRDFMPLLGGPFNKQLYYRDYLRMISASFFAFHHDPLARDLVSIMTDFTMGRGFQLKADNPANQVIWDSFYKANDLATQFDYAALELSIYGEVMWMWLANNETRISYQPRPGEIVPRGIIPRVRLTDPSNIAEIITVPEDPILGVLAYVWLAPTQYQMWTDHIQPSAKFIYTQIPADRMMHFKVNSVSNEKRGRSDYFPSLGYMKRLRDAVNYAIIGDQKASAWAMDTTIEGDANDIDSYIAAQKALGTLPPAGSEFVHTASITRKFMANEGSAPSDKPSFAWCLNMACLSAGIPISYLGTHLSGSTNRASALTSTEPVAKRFERRRLVYNRMIDGMYKRALNYFGRSGECEIIWPELITQDRSQKLKDLIMVQNASYFSHERAATIAAKELDQKDFKYATEMADILAEDNQLGISPAEENPLTTPGAATNNKSTQSITAPERTQIKNNMRKL